MHSIKEIMTKQHILFVEPQPLYAEMFHLWILHLRQVGRVSHIPDWSGWWDVEGNITGVFARMETVTNGVTLPGELFERHPVSAVTLLGEGPAVEVPGCVVNHLRGQVEREDFLHAMGLKSTASKPKKGQALTEKETTVVSLTVKGYSMKEIAEETECTVSTVQTYKQRAMEKLKVENLPDLSVTAAAKGLRDCPCQRIHL